jgi:uncharacterized flavoprotein (TIGR03862 family)
MNTPLTTEIPFKTVAVIGAGPAGLMAAEMLIKAGIKVNVYDAMPSVGRKFLMAGKGGMNITHAETFDKFVARYSVSSDFLKPMLTSFPPESLRAWIHELGITTFTGSSGRVFPVGMKAAPLLRAWLHRLRNLGVVFYVRHRWLGWDDANPHLLRFSTNTGEKCCRFDAVILACGGGSWARLGSTGAWVQVLSTRGIEVNPLKPANCGFDVGWSDHFSNRFAGVPVKTVSLGCMDSNGIVHGLKGEIMITSSGIEGTIVYALSSILRELVETCGFAAVTLDLMPDKSLEYVTARLSQARGKQSFSNLLRKALGINGVKAGLLQEILTDREHNNPVFLAAVIKNLRLKLVAARPIDEAISSAGGVSFTELDEHLMLREFPGVFCAGEMLDFDAPTGGYLFTAAFATGRAAGLGALNWLQQ